MSDFKLVLSQNTTTNKDGIYFEDISYIKVLIDQIDLLETDIFIDAFLYFDELEKSIHADGEYLLFTCACGIADDSGWKKVRVSHVDEYIMWEILLHNNIIKTYKFEKTLYVNEISNINMQINNIRIQLEPKYVVFPE